MFFFLASSDDNTLAHCLDEEGAVPRESWIDTTSSVFFYVFSHDLQIIIDRLSLKVDPG